MRYKIYSVNFPFKEYEKIDEVIKSKTVDVFYYTVNNKGKLSNPKAKRLQLWTNFQDSEEELELKKLVYLYLTKN